jgi:hypothetical protein
MTQEQNNRLFQQNGWAFWLAAFRHGMVGYQLPESVKALCSQMPLAEPAKYTGVFGDPEDYRP